MALVSKVSMGVRRLLLGQPFRSDKLSHTLLPKRIALPVFASDAMSSVAYAPEEIFLVLSVAGLSALVMAPWVGLAVAMVMLVVVVVRWRARNSSIHTYNRSSKIQKHTLLGKLQHYFKENRRNIIEKSKLY